MPSVFTIQGDLDGHKRKGKSSCKRVRSGKRGCTIELCKVGRRWKFQKGTYRCHR